MWPHCPPTKAPVKHASLLALMPLMPLLALAGAAEPAFRYSAPVTVEQAGAFVQLPLPASAYGHILQPGLGDLRIVDAQGQRVPFAILPPRAGLLQREETLREASVYPLPRRSAPGAALASQVEVLVQGDSIRVRKLGTSTAGTTNPAPADTPGWLFDLGERKRDEPAPQALRLAWSGPAEFGVAFDIDTSDTLREWRPGGSGQLLALRAPAGPLVQREVPLPADTPRFVRLVWRDAGSAPALTGAQAVQVRQHSQEQDAPSTWKLPPTPEPAGKTAPPPHALHFDLGGTLPLAALDLQLPPGTRVAPVRLQGRTSPNEPWRELGAAVFYRIERDGAASQSPPFSLAATVRYVRVLPDDRSPALDPTATQLVVQARLARLLLANQGTPPLRLLAGAADAPPGALPIGSLLPQLEAERPHFGQARLGAWSEEASVARQAAAAERQAALRPWLLWGVLLAGVAGLGWMVWTLARGKASGTP
jgi:hypothetical protein